MKKIEDVLFKLHMYIREYYRDSPELLIIELRSGRKFTMPFPESFPLVNEGPPPQEPEEDDWQPFQPTAFQKGILKALDGKAMRTDALGAAVGDRSRLFRKGGLNELKDRGLVEHNSSIGYYRPDAPPPGLHLES